MFDRNPTNSSLIAGAAEWHADGHGVALAFVIQTWGSSPRPVGSVMIIRDDMLVEGSVSGGCVESAVIEAGGNAITTGGGKRLDFGVADETAWEVGLSCGGRIAVLVSPVGSGGITPQTLASMASDLRARRPVTLCLNAASGMLEPPSSSLMPEASYLDEASDLFYLVQPPARRLVIVGGVHISQFLAPMAKLAGYDVTIIDPRAVFTAAARFPDIECVTDWPDEAMRTLGLDARTAIVTLTHDPKIDDPGLHAALSSDAFYVACLGSRRTHAARCARLQEAGIGVDEVDRHHGPAGLNIGALTPAEIAVSILAEMIAAERMPGEMSG